VEGYFGKQIASDPFNTDKQEVTELYSHRFGSPPTLSTQHCHRIIV
jgi:hypothetical protein